MDDDTTQFDLNTTQRTVFIAIDAFDLVFFIVCTFCFVEEKNIYVPKAMDVVINAYLSCILFSLIWNQKTRFKNDSQFVFSSYFLFFSLKNVSFVSGLGEWIGLFFFADVAYRIHVNDKENVTLF